MKMKNAIRAEKHPITEPIWLTFFYISLRIMKFGDVIQAPSLPPACFPPYFEALVEPKKGTYVSNKTILI